MDSKTPDTRHPTLHYHSKLTKKFPSDLPLLIGREKYKKQCSNEVESFYLILRTTEESEKALSCQIMQFVFWVCVGIFVTNGTIT